MPTASQSWHTNKAPEQCVRNGIVPPYGPGHFGRGGVEALPLAALSPRPVVMLMRCAAAMLNKEAGQGYMLYDQCNHTLTGGLSWALNGWLIN